MYLTDGTFLYRFAGYVASTAGQVALLEDCYLLDVVCVPVADLRARELRVVKPDAGLKSGTSARLRRFSYGD